MKIFSKITSSVAVLSAAFLVSCDSDTELDFGGVSPEDTTETDQTVVAGELFTFVDLLQIAPQPRGQIRITSTNTAEISDDLTLEYEKTSEFTATLQGQTDVNENVDLAVLQLFSTDNALNTEIRSLLLVEDPSLDEPDLTVAERDRLIELLNVAGAEVFINPDNENQLIVDSNTIYTITSTSTQSERALGLIGGTYARESISEVIQFNITTLPDGEGSSFQFYFPAVSPVSLPVQLFEQGTYTLQLANESGP